MIINVARVLNIKRHLPEFSEGSTIRLAYPIKNIPKEELMKIGFSEELRVGERVLPDSSLSRYSFENSEGKCVKRKDLPMEIAERYWEWSWEDRAGNSYWDYTYVPYKRYVREYYPPIVLELIIAGSDQGEKWVATDLIEYTAENIEKLKLAANLLLSLFGSCYPVNMNFDIPIIPNKTCDWEILRPGERLTTEKIEKAIQKYTPEKKQNMYRRNVALLLQKNELEVIAMGTKGFSGYLVFTYPEKGTVILESLMPNNATYILGTNWESVSQMTKSEVIDQNLHLDRIYHYSSWEERIAPYLT